MCDPEGSISAESLPIQQPHTKQRKVSVCACRFSREIGPESSKDILECAFTSTRRNVIPMCGIVLPQTLPTAERSGCTLPGDDKHSTVDFQTATSVTQGLGKKM